MIYKYTYFLNGRLLYHTCRNVKEAELWFDLMLAYNVESFRVDTIKYSRLGVVKNERY